MSVLALPCGAGLTRAVISFGRRVRRVTRVLAVMAVAFLMSCGPRVMVMEEQKADGGIWGPWFFHSSNLRAVPDFSPNGFLMNDHASFEWSVTEIPRELWGGDYSRTVVMSGQRVGDDGWLLKVPWGDISAGFYRSFHFAEDPVVMAFLSDDLTRAWVLWRPMSGAWRGELDQVMTALTSAGFDTAQLRDMDTGFPELEAYR